MITKHTVVYWLGIAYFQKHIYNHYRIALIKLLQGLFQGWDDLLVTPSYSYQVYTLLMIYQTRYPCLFLLMNTVSLIYNLFCAKKCAVMAEFKTIDGSARWPKSFNFNQTPYASTVPSIQSFLTQEAVAALLVLSPRGRNISFIIKNPHRLCCHLKLTNKIKLPIL